MSRPQPRRSSRRIKKGILTLLCIALILAVVRYSPLFVLRTLSVDGVTYIPQEDFWTIANVYRGEPLFELRTDEVQRRLKSDLRIEDAQVRRVLPDGLAIHIQERWPLATLPCEYGYVDLDRQGKIINVHKNLNAMHIPMITGFSLSELYLGDTVQDETIDTVLEFLSLLDADSIAQLSELSIVDAQEILAFTNGAVQIRLGDLRERKEEKAKLTQGFLQDLKSAPHPIEYVDFRYKSPVIKLKQ